MNLNQIPNEVCKREKTKKQAHIQAARAGWKHTKAILVEDAAEGGDMIETLYKQTLARAEKKKTRLVK